MNLSKQTFLKAFLSVFSLKSPTLSRHSVLYNRRNLNNQLDPCAQNTLGQLIKYMPMTISFEKEACAMERLRKLQTDLIASWNYECYPTDQILSCLIIWGTCRMDFKYQHIDKLMDTYVQTIRSF